MAKLAPFFPDLGRSWTTGAYLPGGGYPWDCTQDLRDLLMRRYPFLPPRTLDRYARSYGMMTEEMLEDATETGRIIGADLTEREVKWLMRTEWAQTADDILWRRTKLGLRFDATQRAALEALMAEYGEAR